MFCIIGNFGDPTIALIEWLRQWLLKQESMQPVTVLSVDTGWADACWQARVEKAEAYAKSCGFSVVRLQAQPSFPALAVERSQFSSQKFSWCSTYLKALPINEGLDNWDPEGEATVVLGKRRAASRINANLPEFIEESEHFNQRKVWYPLWDCDTQTFNELISRAGFPILNHRSLECEPCIYSNDADFARMSPASIEKTHLLENKLQCTMFNENIETMVANAKLKKVNITDMPIIGCAASFVCGE